jgi:Flp pilus assembly protein TadG
VTRRDSGSAVVEFVLVVVLVVVLVLALVQLAVALYVRNTLVAAAAEGARFAATQNEQPSGGAEYAAALIRYTLPSSFADDVTAGYETIGGVPTVVVEVRTTLPVLGWIGPSDSLVVRGHAVSERA